MINFIKGEVISAQNGTIVLECNGIGYEIFVSNNTIIKTVECGNEAKILCYMNVKTDGVVLYGFHSIEEKSMFLKLITISGVGPKAAMSILSGIDLGALVTAIITKDIKTLTTVKGIGKKTAERIVLELKESIAKENILTSNTELGECVDIADKDLSDAIMALRSLGIAQKEAVRAVQLVNGNYKNIEELISKALKNL